MQHKVGGEKAELKEANQSVAKRNAMRQREQKHAPARKKGTHQQTPHKQLNNLRNRNMLLETHMLQLEPPTRQCSLAARHSRHRSWPQPAASTSRTWTLRTDFRVPCKPIPKRVPQKKHIPKYRSVCALKIPIFFRRAKEMQTTYCPFLGRICGEGRASPHNRPAARP